MKRLLARARRGRRARGAASRRRAHPLGNFTINRYSELDVAGNRALRPLRARPGRDPDVPGAAGRRGSTPPPTRAGSPRTLHLTVDGRPARLVPVRNELAFPPGQGGLHTTRLEVLLRRPEARRGGAARLPRRQLRRPASAGRRSSSRRRAGARLTQLERARSTASATGCSRTRRTCSQSPLDVTSATAVGRARSRPPARRRRSRRAQAARPARGGPRGRRLGLRALIVHDQLGGWFVLASLFDRVLLGRRARAQPGPRQVDRRRVPRRLARHRAARAAARRRP